MASQNLTPKSRLAQMQMRFQQKQQEELALKKREMKGEEETIAPGDMKKTGKVREMFDRRRVAGIDRSNPLKPISSTATQNANINKQVPALGAHRPIAFFPRVSTQNLQRQTNAKRQQTISRNVNDDSKQSVPFNGNLPGLPRSNARTHNYDELDNLDNETFPKEFSSLSLGESAHNGVNKKYTGDRNNNSSGTFSRGKSPAIKLNPVVVQKKSPMPVAFKARPMPAKVAPPAKHNLKTASTASSVKTGRNKISVMGAKPPPEGMGTCKYCGRHFNLDRLGKHEAVCLNMANTKRKVFDTTKQRIQGTDVADFQKKKGAGAANKQPPPPPTTKKNNWRKKHEDFINAIRAAKQVQAHLARGGDLRDLPPPPPSENPDYIQCPHCGRRFNETAAERHIPKCATMIHNKPKKR